MKNIFFVILLCVGTIGASAQWIIKDGIASCTNDDRQSIAYDWTKETGHIFAIGGITTEGDHYYSVDGWRDGYVYLSIDENNVGLVVESKDGRAGTLFLDCILGESLEIPDVGVFNVSDFTISLGEATAILKNN